MEETIFRNEFAMVEVKRDESANGVRLYVRDMITGACVYLDPMQLEALTRTTPRHFAPLLDPSGTDDALTPERLARLFNGDVKGGGHS